MPGHADDNLRELCKRRLNRSRCCLGCGLGWGNHVLDGVQILPWGEAI